MTQGSKNGRNISGMCKTSRENCPKKDSSTLFLCDDHKWRSSRQRLASEKRKETMAKIDKAPMYVRVANVLTLTLLRVGFKLVGPGLVIGNYPMYLLTVRGRKSGQPRTVAVAIIQRNGKRYVGSPYGIVAWVRNLRAAGEATLTRRRRSETVTAGGTAQRPGGPRLPRRI